MVSKWEAVTFFLISVYISFINNDRFKVWNRSEPGGPLIALILARGGSKGIQLKNLATINNTSLLAHSINVIKQSNKFDSVWVSTDNFKIEREARKMGAYVHHRTAYTATDSATSLIAVLEFLKFHPEVAVLGLVQATSPFIKASYLSSAAEMMSSGKYNSVFSVCRQHKLRWYNNSGEYFPANFNPLYRPRRQDWDGELVENGMFYFAKASDIVKLKSLQPQRVGIVEVPERDSFEIDTPSDLNLAKFLAQDHTTWKEAS